MLIRRLEDFSNKKLRISMQNACGFYTDLLGLTTASLRDYRGLAGFLHRCETVGKFMSPALLGS